MNRLPTKQIYLLFIIIVGIIALSVYSTYALFTYENSTSDIVSIHIPKSLTISENIYEYQQITVEPNTVATTDIDIYNSFEYEVCYSIWYKVIGGSDIQNNVQIFELTPDTLTSSGVLSATTNIRVTVAIVNDNDNEIKINLGTIGKEKEAGSCSLNITSDKSVVSTAYETMDNLTTKLIKDTTTAKTNENYLTYKNVQDTFSLKNTDKVYISKKFTYSNELFSLTDSEYITIQELLNKNNLQSIDVYMCKENNSCSILYKIETGNIQKDNNTNNYIITKYDKMIGYSAGENGLRKINATDYIYYGDNPNNFIYYNCSNNDDLTTCEIWRIVGFFYNKSTGKYTTKIIKNNSIGTYQFDYKMENGKNISSNIWNDSTLQKYLNEEYKLKNNYTNYLEEYTTPVERIPNLESEIKNMRVTDETITSKINLLNLSDYLYASSCNKNKINEYTGECLKNNWLNNIEIPKEWTLTSKEVEVIVEETTNEITETEDNTTNNSDETDATENNQEESQNNEITDNNEIIETEESTETVDKDNYVINYVYTIGKDISEQDINDAFEIRPVVFLKSRMILLDGNGSLETPYVVK